MKKLYYIKKTTFTNQDEDGLFLSSMDFNEDEPVIYYNSKEKAMEKLESAYDDFLNKLLDDTFISTEHAGEVDEHLNEFIYCYPPKNGSTKTSILVDLNNYSQYCKSYEYVAVIKEIIFDFDN